MTWLTERGNNTRTSVVATPNKEQEFIIFFTPKAFYKLNPQGILLHHTKIQGGGLVTKVALGQDRVVTSRYNTSCQVFDWRGNYLWGIILPALVDQELEPILTEDKIYFTCNYGDQNDLDPEILEDKTPQPKSKSLIECYDFDGNKEWASKLDTPMTQPTLHQGKIYTSQEGQVIIIDGTKGTIEKRLSLFNDSLITSPILVQGDTLYFGVGLDKAPKFVSYNLKTKQCNLQDLSFILTGISGTQSPQEQQYLTGLSTPKQDYSTLSNSSGSWRKNFPNILRVALSNENIFVVTQEKNKRTLYCLSTDGTVTWQTDPTEFQVKDIAVTEKQIICTDSIDRIVALDQQGKHLWDFKTKEKFVSNLAGLSYK